MAEERKSNFGTGTQSAGGGQSVAEATEHRQWERIVDFDVVDTANNKIGTVQNLWIDERGQPTFLGVKTGWVFGKNHVVPVWTATVNGRQRIVRVPFSEDKIKDAPAFDAENDLSEADEQSVRMYYGMTGSSGMPRGESGQTQAQRAAQGEAPPKIQPTRRPQATGTSGREQEGTTIPLSEEQMRVGKREVEAGGVRLRKIVRTEVVNQPVELKREEVVIERVPASGAQTGAGARAFEQEDVFIPLRREEAVVQKEARVREEVQVRKGSTTERQNVSEQVRKEDVEIEKEGEARFETGSGKPRQTTPPYEPKERSRR